MLYIVVEVILFISFLSLFLKDKKSIGKLSLLIVLFIAMWILFWGNLSNADYLTYLKEYNYIMQTGNFPIGREIGWCLLMKISSNFGLKYYQFLMVVSFIGLSLIMITVRKYTDKPQFALILYFIYPYLLDIIQVRQFLAMSIIVFCLRYLEKNTITENIKYIIGVLIACSIHYLSLIFLPLFIIKNLKTKQLYIIVFVAIAVSFYFVNDTFIQKAILSYIPFIQYKENYFLHRARMGFLVVFAIQSIIFGAVYYSKKFLEKHGNKEIFISIVYKINVYLFILFPLEMINVIFFRAYRIIMVPNYILFSLVFLELGKRSKVQFLAIIIILVSLLFIYSIVPVRNTVIFPIFEKNLLLRQIL